jgi:hypothetical protein
MTNVELATVTDRLQKQEVFENETTIFFTHEVDPAYKAVVDEMAVAIYQHDKGLDKTFPTGDVYVDDPYRCKADDALRAAIPLLRKKFADELLEGLDS